MNKRVFVPFTLVLLLAGCAGITPAERAAMMQQEVEEMIQVYGPACEKLGYQADTDAWRECILKLNTTNAVRHLEYEYSTHMAPAGCRSYRGFFRCPPF
ncbi:MAG: hypothetical protein KUL75_06175 [Sterolibacterium sp.]|nr:hypothetical protein [Sterolibacterium sp.]